MNKAVSHFGNINKPILLEVPEGGLIYELRQALETVTRSSTDGFNFISLDDRGFEDTDKIFKENKAPQLNSIPVVTVDNAVVIFVKALTGKIIPLRAFDDSTVDAIKQEIECQLDIPMVQIRIIYLQRELKNGEAAIVTRCVRTDF